MNTPQPIVRSSRPAPLQSAPDKLIRRRKLQLESEEEPLVEERTLSPDSNPEFMTPFPLRRIPHPSPVLGNRDCYFRPPLYPRDVHELKCRRKLTFDDEEEEVTSQM